ncbi:MAG TPA: thiamine pyrophosphate-binding protein, partial [Solirubrobacteraceae bacterium]|nr:thiamine pyrophosphate-binding protein [Solirubrobacteraceae bacterium]
MPPLFAPTPARQAVLDAVELLAGAERPAIVAGRGAVLAHAGPALEELGQRLGAILATSAPANGLFAGLPYALGISGGFASPLAQELLPQADVVVIAGASANQWTTRHGKLIGPEARVIQIDTEPRAIGRNRPADVALLCDARAAAVALNGALAPRTAQRTGFRTPELAEQIAARRWQHEPYEDASTEQFIDPRTLSIELNRLLPPARAVVVDSGHFMGYPSMYLDVPDAESWVFVNGFQAVGLALGAGIGAAI